MSADLQTTQLLEQLRIAVHADHSRRHRRRVGAAVAIGVMVLSGGAWAAATQAPWWQSGSAPVDPQAVASVARDNLPAAVDTTRARTVARDGDAALVAVPLGQTGYCLIPALDGRGDLGAQCEYQVEAAQVGADDRLESYAQPAGRRGGPAWIVYGRVTDARAQAIDLGALRIALGPGGFFLAEIPTELWGALDGSANEGRVLDDQGHPLRRGCVSWGSSPDSSDGSGGTPLWSEGDGPCTPHPRPTPPTVDYGRAQTLFEVRLSGEFSIWKPGTTIAFWRAPASDGTVCIFPGPVSQPDLGSNPPGGADCRDPGSAWPPQQGPLSPSLGAQRVHVGGRAGYAYATYGRVDPSAGIAELELRSPAGTTPVALADDYFFAQIPETSASAGTLPPGSFTLVAHDAAGRQVAAVSLNELQAKAGPR